MMDLKNAALKFLSGDSESDSYNGPYLLQSGKLDILLRVPRQFEDVHDYADCLMEGSALMISFTDVDSLTKNRIFDYLNGVSYIIHATVSKVSDSLLLYAPEQVEVDRETVRKTSWLSR